MSCALRAIEIISEIRINVFKDGPELPKNGLMGSDQTSANDILHLVLDIYGPAEHAKLVGAELSKANFYLQHPYQLEPGKIYENPHYFKCRTSRDWQGSQNHLPIIEAPKSDEPKDKRADSVIEQVLQARVQNESIKEVEAEKHVTTILLPHQKQALHFILQREQGVVDNDLSLWNVEGTEQQPRYSHKIKKCFRTEKYPTETRGGIIADEMGLGKTLSLISAIVNSLGQARTFSPRHQRVRQISAVRRSRATLVIAPSMVLLDGWLEEIDKYESLKYKVIH